MSVVCDTVEAGDESMFRLNEDKLLKEMLAKAQRVSVKGLPQSMEEKFVRKALEAPILGVKSNAATKPAEEQKDSSPETGTSTPQLESVDSQSSVSTADASVSFVSEASTAATSIPDDTTETSMADVTAAIRASTAVVQLQRLKVAFDFICSSYLAPGLAGALKKRLVEQKPVDFAPLDDYVAQLAQVRQEAGLARSAADFSRK